MASPPPPSPSTPYFPITIPGGFAPVAPQSPVTLEPPQAPRPVSRRRFVGGLLGLTALVGSGVAAWFVLTQTPLARTFSPHATPTTLASPSPVPTVTPGSSPTPVTTPNPTPLPRGGTLLTYRGHGAAVYTVAWLPGGRRIASAGLGGTVEIWDVATGRKDLVYNSNTAKVYSVAWSPDGSRIASGHQDGTVQVWNATTGDHILTYSGHSKWVNAVAWSPDGTRIASGSADKTVQVWEAGTGNPLVTYSGHSKWVNGWPGRMIAHASSQAAVMERPTYGVLLMVASS